MREYISIGSTPPEEPCLQLGNPDCTVTAQKEECQRYIALLREFFGEERGTAHLGIRGFAHDFGTYYEVVCYYDDQDEIGQDYAFACESEGPLTWDDKGPYIWKEGKVYNGPLHEAIAKDAYRRLLTKVHKDDYIVKCIRNAEGLFVFIDTVSNIDVTQEVCNMICTLAAVEDPNYIEQDGPYVRATFDEVELLGLLGRALNHFSQGEED